MTMITFKYKSTTKRVKIRTNHPLDARMSHWLQKVFNIKHGIVGYRTADNKYYDVEAFHSNVERLYGSQVEIIESSEQGEISFTSDNLNSSSFLKPSQQNSHSQPQQRQSEEDQARNRPNLGTQDDQPPQRFNSHSEASLNGPCELVQDFKSFEANFLQDNSDITVGFESDQKYLRAVQSLCQGLIQNAQTTFGRPRFIFIQSANMRLHFYVGKSCVLSCELNSGSQDVLRLLLSRAGSNRVGNDNRGTQMQKAEDQAPSFTTHNVQERISMETCLDNLLRMHKQQLLRSTEYTKLYEKCQDNFPQFLKLFCENIFDSDYDSFKSEVLVRVENNLELLLNNVNELDLSRPISREEQRKNRPSSQNLPQSTQPVRQKSASCANSIHIVKVESYFEVLDGIKHLIHPNLLAEVKQLLLDENTELCSYFGKNIKGDTNKETLASQLNMVARQSVSASHPALEPDTRPISRCLPRPLQQPNSKKGSKVPNKLLDSTPLEEPPMFGSLRQQTNFSPIKYMSDIESLYKQAQEKIGSKSESFEAEQFGLLFHYLQTHDDSISGFIQQLDFNVPATVSNLRNHLLDRLHSLLLQQFTQAEIEHFASNKCNEPLCFIYENFKYESDITRFIAGLKQQAQRLKPFEKVLHKKSSDSQLLGYNQKQQPRRRKYSDEQQDSDANDAPLPSPKHSDTSIYRPDFTSYKDFLLSSWRPAFEKMLAEMALSPIISQSDLRDAFKFGQPSLFPILRSYMNGKSQWTAEVDLRYPRSKLFRKSIESKEWVGRQETILIVNQILKALVKEEKLSEQVRKWAIAEYADGSKHLLQTIESFFVTNNETILLEQLNEMMRSQHSNKDQLLLQKVIHIFAELSPANEITHQIFKEFSGIVRAACELYLLTGNLEEALETLHVLHLKYMEMRLAVATLNFSGINCSPFEYHDGSDEIVSLSSICEKIMQEYKVGSEWKLGKIDKLYQKNRCSVSYDYNQLADGGKLLDEGEFKEKWRKMAQEESLPSDKPEDREQALLMDLIHYYSVIELIYSVQARKGNLKSLDPEPLLRFLSKRHNRAASSLEIKKKIVVKYVQASQIDVLFLQQAGNVSWEEVFKPTYGIAKQNGSIVVYKKEKVGEGYQQPTQQYKDQLNFNNDSAAIFTTKGFLLISAHLSASAKVCPTQYQEALKVIEGILSNYSEIRIVMGMDANHRITDSFLRSQPRDPQAITTIKKRTQMQAQLRKAQVLVTEAKDFIVSNRHVKKAVIGSIDGDCSTKTLLPNEGHPFDHFLVAAIID